MNAFESGLKQGLPRFDRSVYAEQIWDHYPPGRKIGLHDLPRSHQDPGHPQMSLYEDICLRTVKPQKYDEDNFAIPGTSAVYHRLNNLIADIRPVDAVHTSLCDSTAAVKGIFLFVLPVMHHEFT